MERIAYSSDPSLLPRLRPLVPLRELVLFNSDLLSSRTRCKTASSYAASREFIVERRLVEVMSFWFCGDSTGLVSTWRGR